MLSRSNKQRPVTLFVDLQSVDMKSYGLWLAASSLHCAAVLATVLDLLVAERKCRSSLV